MTFSIPELTRHLARPAAWPAAVQVWIFLALFAGFAIKVPLFPLHTWLPLAHIEAPAAGSVLLAGVLLKIGTYGFLRFNLPMLPDATAACMPWLLWLSVAGIIYGALVALAQSDMKRLIAYSSVSHLGFCMLGIFALNRAGRAGRRAADDQPRAVHRRPVRPGRHDLRALPHAARSPTSAASPGRRPVLAFFMVFMTLASIGLPGLNGFVGEFLLLLGMFQRGWADAPRGPGPRNTASSPCWPSAAWSWGPGTCCRWCCGSSSARLREPRPRTTEPPVRDLSLARSWPWSPCACVIVWIGVQPKFFLDRMAPSLDRAAPPSEVQAARSVAESPQELRSRRACCSRRQVASALATSPRSLDSG